MASAAELQADLSALAGRLEERTTTALDPQEDGDRRLIESFLDLANKRSDRYPALHEAMNRADCVANAHPEELRIVDAGRTKGGHATARAWHAAQGGAYLSGVVTVVLDSDSGELLAVGNGTQVGGTLTDAPTGMTAAQAGSGVTALSFFHAQGTPEAPPRFGAALETRQILKTSEFKIELAEPKKVIAGPPPILIAVGRTFVSPGVDYCYLARTEEVSPAYLLLPFEGEALNIPSPIKEIDPNNKIPNLEITTNLYAEAHGAPLVSLTNENATLGRIEAIPSSNGIKWKCGFDENKRYPDTTESLEYGQAPQYNTAELWFAFEFRVPITNPTKNRYAFSVCSEGHGTPSETCKEISKVKFWWHCLAAGTEVKLEDGSTKPIEEVENLFRVRTGFGGTLGVGATTRGIHRDGEGPQGKVFRLLTEQGRELTLSALHPVMTPAGLRQAMDLRPGDAVLTEDGPDPVRSCEETPYEGLLFNLVLVDEKDRSEGLSPPFGSFLANGIVVGDFESQAAQYQALRHDLDYMKARLPEANYADFENALADIAAAS